MREREFKANLSRQLPDPQAELRIGHTPWPRYNDNFVLERERERVYE
jgi:hypothetical protein